MLRLKRLAVPGARAALVAAVTLGACAPVSAQPLRRLRGRVSTSNGAPIANAQVSAEAVFGYAAGSFAGQRTFATTTDGKGDWNILGFKSGIWLISVDAPGFVPEAIVLPIQILTTDSPLQGGIAFTWVLVLKALPMPDGETGRTLTDAVAALRSGDVDRTRLIVSRVPEGAEADYLAAAGRVSLIAHDPDTARALFTRALDQDKTSYRAALGMASASLLRRDFDSASRAFDAARSRTPDKDEQKFLTVAIGDLATIKTR